MRVTKSANGGDRAGRSEQDRPGPSSRCCVGLTDVDPMRVATRTISGLYDGATTRELDQLSIQTAAAHITEEPQYARLAARLPGDVHRQGGPRSGDPVVLSQSIANA